MKAYHWRGIVAERDRLARLAKGEPLPGAPDVKVSAMPKDVKPMTRETVEALKVDVSAARRICVECAFYSENLCMNPKARSPVSGQAMDAGAVRKDKFSCGPGGHYWGPRPAKSPRARVVRDNTEPVEYAPPAWVPVRKQEPFRDEVLVVLWER